MKIAYIERNFRGEALAIIEQANAICADYAGQGYDLTLRQLYYQFVARDLIPNSDKSYKRLGSIINDARLAGLLSWHYITDRGRNVVGDLSGYETTPEELIQRAARGYFEDLWAEQPRRIEVWVEKEALGDIVRRAAGGLRCASFPNKGYVSQSEMWAAGRRIMGYFEEDKDPLILHLGDHDPSGIDMTRDIRDRLSLFAEQPVEVRRIALNMPQIEQYQPPPNPAKITDSRAEDYIATYGSQSWELDALPPQVLDDLIQSHIRTEMDLGTWAESKRREASVRSSIVAVADHWEEITEQFGDR
jgi:hypothetical protein